MGGVLWSGRHLVTKAVAALINVFWHTKVHSLFCVVPIEVYAKEYVSIPIDCAFILFGKVRDEVFGVVVTGIFHAKFVDDESNINGLCCMFE